METINKLSNGPTSSNPPCLVTANQVAHQLLVNGRGTMPSKPKRPVLPPATEGDTYKVYPFSEGEYNNGVAALNNNKAAGRYDILVEQLKHLGPVVVRLPRPMEGIFRSFQNCQFHHRRLESLDHFNVIYIYHSEHYGLSFLDLTDAIFYKVSLFVYISNFASTLCMCVMYLTSI